MAEEPLTFNADERKAERQRASITIGGRQFRRAPKTPERMERYFDELPDDAPTGEQLRDDIKLVKEFSKKENDVTYSQLAILLLDEEGAEADVNFLRSECEIDDAEALLELLVPSQRELDRRGNSSEADGPTA